MSLDLTQQAYAFALQFEKEGKIPKAVEAWEMAVTFASDIVEPDKKIECLVGAIIRIVALLHDNVDEQTRHLVSLIEITKDVLDQQILFQVATETYKFAERLLECEKIVDAEHWLETAERLARRSGTPDALLVAGCALVTRYSISLDEAEMIKKIASEVIQLARGSKNGAALGLAANMAFRAGELANEEGRISDAKYLWHEVITLGNPNQTSEGARTEVAALARYLYNSFPAPGEDPKTYRQLAKTLVLRAKDLHTSIGYGIGAEAAFNLAKHYNLSSEDSLARSTFLIAIELGKKSRSSKGKAIASRARVGLAQLG